MADIDPADQWVLEPETGRYAFRPQGPPPPRLALPPADRDRRPPPEAAGVRPPGRRGSHRAPRRRPGRRTLLAWGLGALALLLCAGGLTGALLYRHLDGNLRTVDVGDAGSRNVAPAGPLNILLIGTDRRVGLGRRYGDAGSAGHADTTILLHIAADRSDAVALSIPRDLVTDVPDCPTRRPDGSVRVIHGLRGVRFNVSLGQQGRDPGCVMRTVQTLTGIRPDHFLMADFSAVKALSTEVGGVRVCLARDIDDTGGSGLRLARGEHLLAGEQALAFLRTRHAVGNGGDLDRIRLQQQFLASLLRAMSAEGTLTDPPKVWRLAEGATRALTVDTGIGSVARLGDLARDLGEVGIRHVTFTTVPVVDNPAEGRVRRTVVLGEPAARQLFRLVAADRPLTAPDGPDGPGTPDVAAPAPDAADSAVPADAEGGTAGPLPGDLAVTVFNGSGVTGAARATVRRLRDGRGLAGAVLGGNAAYRTAVTTLAYPPGEADRARALAALLGLPDTAPRPAPDAAAGGALTLTLGEDFPGPDRTALPPAVAPAATPPGPPPLRASDADACAG